MEVFDDVGGEGVGIREVIEVGEGLVLDPEIVKAGLVALEEELHGEAAPAAVRVVLGPGLLALIAVLRVIAAHEILQVGVAHGVLLEGEVDVGPEVVHPNLLRLHVRAGGFAVEEQHIGLDAGLVEDARRQAQYGVQLAGLQQLFAHGLARAALKQHVVRQHHGGPAVGFQQGVDVLEEVQLLVGAGGPEILAVVDQILFLRLALLVGESEGGFLPERRVGHDQRRAVTRVAEQRVTARNGHPAIQIADIMQIQVHQAQLVGHGHQLRAVEGVVLDELLLLAGQ